MGKDLGTYHAKVYYDKDRSFISEYHTGLRYTGGGGHTHPIDAMLLKPIWESEQDLIDSIVFKFSENECDCNLELDYARAYHLDEPENPECGFDWKLEKITLVRPDGSEKEIYAHNM